jgi:hypothetical protein
MEAPAPRPPLSGPEKLEILAAAAVLAWRLIAHPERAGTDWVSIVALYWMLTVALRSPRALQAVSLLAVTHLLCVYLLGQFPHAFFAIVNAL